MLVLNQAPSGAISAQCSSSSPLKFTHPNPPLFSDPKSKFLSRKTLTKSLNLTLLRADGGADSGSSTKQAMSDSRIPPSFDDCDPVFVTHDRVSLDGVIQFEKSDVLSRLNKWGWVALLSGGDVLALLLFSAIGRLNHGFSVFDFETFSTADPFIAGWFLSAYFLGGYGEEGCGMNGLRKAVIAATKSWTLGIPLGIIIRTATLGHIPPYSFVSVVMGSTPVLLIGWRTLFFSVLPNYASKKNYVFQRDSPFQLYKLLTSFVRRW